MLASCNIPFLACFLVLFEFELEQGEEMTIIVVNQKNKNMIHIVVCCVDYSLYAGVVSWMNTFIDDVNMTSRDKNGQNTIESKQKEGM